MISMKLHKRRENINISSITIVPTTKALALRYT